VQQLPELQGPGVRGRLIAGEAYGMKSGVSTHSPLFYVHCELDAGATLQVPMEHTERAVYVAQGTVEIGGTTVDAGTMAVLSPSAAALVQARTPALVMLLGGEPIGPRYIEWNFVSSSRDRIEQAKADWRAGRMKLPDADDQEFIPFPGDAVPPNPMS
jgi:redox-sensitive bicupin YhaK (pirin superfamily)